MRNILQYCFILLICLGTVSAQAQTRYVDEVFDEVNFSPYENGQASGSNYTIMTWIAAALQQVEGHTAARPLIFDIYTPKGDTVTQRPLILYLHTGNFFPFPANGSCGGTLRDPSAKEICTRLAKMGYVVASVDYRLGWLPTNEQELIRRFSLINGAYRGVQDVRTHVRFFKKSVEDLGNPFGVDPDKIVVWGQGTGGYISLASAYLNSYPEIFNTSDAGKFYIPTATGTVPMVIEGYNGNLDANGPVTRVDAAYNTLSTLPIGDTLCIPNNVTYANGDTISSEFQLSVNMGGALGDSSWINAGEIPNVSYHVPSDPFAPYKTNVLQVPTATGPQPVVEVSGSYDVQRILTAKGNNDIFNTIPAGKDPIGEAANGEFPGLLSFTGTPNDASSPWEWTDLSTPGLNPLANCNGDSTLATPYIDSILMYFAPRGCVALGLDCFSSSVEDTQLEAGYMTVAPNPAQSFITVASDRADIQSLTVYTMQGQVVANMNNVNSRRVTIERNSLPDGVYFVKARFEEGVVTHKVMFN